MLIKASATLRNDYPLISYLAKKQENPYTLPRMVRAMEFL